MIATAILSTLDTSEHGRPQASFPVIQRTLYILVSFPHFLLENFSFGSFHVATTPERPCSVSGNRYLDLIRAQISPRMITSCSHQKTLDQHSDYESVNSVGKALQPLLLSVFGMPAQPMHGSGRTLFHFNLAGPQCIWVCVPHSRGHLLQYSC